MPNYCSYSLCAKGSKEGLDELARVFAASVAKDGVGDQFVRVFEAETNWEDENTLYVSGYCAWSVWSAMFETQQRASVGDCRWITLPKLCAKHGLEVEVFGSEPGMNFAEYYRVNEDGLVDEDNEELVPYPEDEDEWNDFDPTDGVVFNTAKGDVAFGEYTI